MKSIFLGRQQSFAPPLAGAASGGKFQGSVLAVQFHFPVRGDALLSEPARYGRVRIWYRSSAINRRHSMRDCRQLRGS